MIIEVKAWLRARDTEFFVKNLSSLQRGNIYYRSGLTDNQKVLVRARCATLRCYDVGKCRPPVVDPMLFAVCPSGLGVFPLHFVCK